MKAAPAWPRIVRIGSEPRVRRRRAPFRTRGTTAASSDRAMTELVILAVTLGSYAAMAVFARLLDRL